MSTKVLLHVGTPKTGTSRPAYRRSARRMLPPANLARLASLQPRRISSATTTG